jgi:hypothetical protein
MMTYYIKLGLLVVSVALSLATLCVFIYYKIIIKNNNNGKGLYDSEGKYVPKKFYNIFKWLAIASIVTFAAWGAMIAFVKTKKDLAGEIISLGSQKIDSYIQTVKPYEFEFMKKAENPTQATKQVAKYLDTCDQLFSTMDNATYEQFKSMKNNKPLGEVMNLCGTYAKQVMSM